MSVRDLEKGVRALRRPELRQFGRWFDTYRQQVQPSKNQNSGELSLEQKQEILKRRAAYLADPSLASPWKGTAQRLIQQVRARRKKALAG